MRLDQATRLGAPQDRVQREAWLCLAQTGQMAQAGPHLGELLLSPGDDGPAICEAYVAGYVVLHRFAEASGLLDGWLADYPNDEQAWFFRGQIDAASNRLTLATESYEKALIINPRRDDIRVVYAETLVKLRQLDAAKREYERLLKSSGNSEDVLRGWIRWLEEAGRTREAISASRKLIGIAEDNFNARLQLADLLYQNGDYKESRAVLEKLRTESPRNKDVRFTLGSVLRLMGDADAAREHLEYAQEAEAELARVTSLVARLQEHPGDLQLRHTVAKTLMTYGREEEGIHWLHSIFAYDPDDIPALETLIGYLESTGQSDKAKPYRERLFRVKEKQPATSRDRHP